MRQRYFTAEKRGDTDPHFRSFSGLRTPILAAGADISTRNQKMEFRKKITYITAFSVTAVVLGIAVFFIWRSDGGIHEMFSGSHSWEVRKQEALGRFPGLPWEAQAIVIADKIDNLSLVLVFIQRTRGVFNQQ